MLPATQPSIVRRMYERGGFAGVPADLAEYVRTEYNGDSAYALSAITRAGRETPAIRTAAWATRVARSLGRLSEALANAFARPSGS